MFINKFNSRYILLIGDDDRINYKNFEKINKYLKFKFRITLSFDNFKSDRDLKINQNKKKVLIKLDHLIYSRIFTRLDILVVK